MPDEGKEHNPIELLTVHPSEGEIALEAPYRLLFYVPIGKLLVEVLARDD